MTTPAYPSTLPLPSGFTLRPTSQLAPSGGGNMGAIALRRRSRQPLADAQVTFTFLEDDYKTFIAWWRDSLLYGHRAFTIALPSAAGLVDHTVRFTEKYKASHRGFRFYEVTAPIEIRERQFPAEAMTCILDPFEGTHILRVSMDEDFSDSSGYGRSPTVVGNSAISAVTPHYGSGCGTFDGTGDWVWYPGATSFALTGEFTLSVWVRPTSAAVGTDRMIATFDHSSYSPHGWLKQRQNGRIGWGIAGYGGADQLSTIDWTLGEWNQIMVTRDALNVIRMFSNGTNNGQTATFSGNMGHSSFPYYVGGSVNTNYTPFVGQLDHLEILTACRATAAFTPPSLPYCAP